MACVVQGLGLYTLSDASLDFCVDTCSPGAVSQDVSEGSTGRNLPFSYYHLLICFPFGLNGRGPIATFDHEDTRSECLSSMFSETVL